MFLVVSLLMCSPAHGFEAHCMVIQDAEMRYDIINHYRMKEHKSISLCDWDSRMAGAVHAAILQEPNCRIVA